MRATSLTCKILMWTVLVISTFFQVLAMFGIGQNNATALEAGKADKVYALWPMIAVTSLLVVGVILFICLRKRPFIGLIVAAVAGLAAVLIAFDLMRAFPAQISASGGDTGLNTFKMIYRHMSPALVPLLMVPAFICDRIVAKQEQARLVADGKARFDLSGAPLFKDGESTLGLPPEEQTESASRKEKRSVRIARKKMENAEP
ncbi:hypothetical protein [Clostridia bacterium]